MNRRIWGSLLHYCRFLSGMAQFPAKGTGMEELVNTWLELTELTKSNSTI
ncbi:MULTISPECIES: hypothetical protein [Petrimonas]|uniref:Uncharacterized protein n=1 Tax=Petrimonas mucosa TaxID=1642646 RepID=A0A1G4G6F6_9BACT|nr:MULTISPECIES: hypothetical protein [Petrimonas]MDD3560213.1 hypothetical protein [Petrimonas mucosa]SCM57353.1 hypothetical protein ING2E5A_1299 [Petrimonas mucosa]SFU32699.1 hypothetical protein SAMN05216364_100472 [Porphyromonadaceae bacterium KHP3R9]HHT29197.1 hypothetical protein [Petrimonas mucosa]